MIGWSTILVKRIVPSIFLGISVVGGLLSLSTMVAIGQTLPAPPPPPGVIPTNIIKVATPAQRRSMASNLEAILVPVSLARLSVIGRHFYLRNF
jgi:hypothetical protein